MSPYIRASFRIGLRGLRTAGEFLLTLACAFIVICLALALIAFALLGAGLNFLVAFTHATVEATLFEPVIFWTFWVAVATAATYGGLRLWAWIQYDVREMVENEVRAVEWDDQNRKDKETQREQVAGSLSHATVAEEGALSVAGRKTGKKK